MKMKAKKYAGGKLKGPKAGATPSKSAKTSKSGNSSAKPL